MKIGVDLTYIPRFKDKLNLAKKILSKEEFVEYQQCFQKESYLASRFALKEAFIKCLELSILSIDLSKIIIRKKENGSVFIEYNGCYYNCSLSHENEYCIGVVIDE